MSPRDGSAVDHTDVHTEGSRDGLATDPKLYAILALAGVGVFSSTVVAPALPGMASAFELTEARVGLVMTAFFATAVIAIPVVGSLADGWGRRRVFLTSLLVYGLAGTLIAFVDSFDVILLLRAIQGLAFPGLLPMSITLIGDWYEGRVATTAQGLLSSVTGLVSVVSPLLAGALVGVSWRLPFGIYALSVVAFVACYRWLPESNPRSSTTPSAATTARSAETTTPSAGTSVDSQRSVTAPVSRASHMTRAVRDALTGETRIVILAVFVIFLVRYGLITFVPLYAVTVLGTNELLGGITVAVLGLGKFLVAPSAGRLAVRFTRPRVLVASLLVFGVPTTMLSLPTDPWIVVVVLGIASVGDGLFDPIANDVVTANATADVRGRVVSVLEVGKTGAIAVAPVVFGAVLATGSYAIAFVTGGLLVSAMAGLVGLTLRER